MARVKCPKCFTVNPDGQERCVQCGAPLPRIRIQAPAPSAPQAPPPGANPGGQLSQGQTLAGRYTILGIIGRGGMGCIYRVRDNTLNEDVALKTLLPQFVRDKMVVERFFNEAKIARKLAHPNIVRVHDIGAADGMVYISMELVRGQSLRNQMERLAPGQRLPAGEILRIAEDLCVALEYAHQYTIHRDIKPENIMVDEQGRVKLMDFGISKLMANTRMTGASVVMGTPFYMSPEQLRNSRDVDARADVFSVGVVLYETLTGSVPTGVPKPPSLVVPTLPKRVDDIVGKCVEPDPAKRYQNAGELRAALRSLRQEMEQGPAAAPKPTTRTRAVALPGNVVGWLLTLAGLLATGGALYAVEQQIASTPAAPPAVEQHTGGQTDVLALAATARDKASALPGPDAQRIRDDADRQWKLANEGGGQAAAEAALRGYIAVLLSPELKDMVYVPGGAAVTGGVTSSVPAFFIDRYEVSQGEFAAFCASTQWRDNCENAGDYAAYPAANVTYYDAQAYAASLGKRLPTSAEWSRAALGDDSSRRFPWEGEYDPAKCNCESGEALPVRAANGDLAPSGCAHLLGNVSEWTRTTTSGDVAADFSSVMVVRGGSASTGETSLAEESTAAFGAYREDLGFRCVKEIPVAGAALDALLR